MTLIELMIAFAALIVLLTIVTTSITTYLNVGSNVISSYQSTDELLPSSIVIQRLIRSEVEPAPEVANTCSGANIPCPPFPVGGATSSSATFFANIGDPNGPAKIVMSATTPTKCGTCAFYSSIFSVVQYPACPNPASSALAGCTTSTPICPFTTISTSVCSWSTAGKQLVTVSGVVNPVTYKTNATAPSIFTYNTLDPYLRTYTAGVTNFSSCAAPTLDANNNPVSSNCPPDDIQSVAVDLNVATPGTPIQENYFVVYRLSSASFLYSPLVG